MNKQQPQTAWHGRKTGWLFNYHVTKVSQTGESDAAGGGGGGGGGKDQEPLEGPAGGLQALQLFFMDFNGGTFDCCVKYEPYFFVAPAEGKEREVELGIAGAFANVVQTVTRVDKEDLGMNNHLSGKQRAYIKITFANTNDLTAVRGKLQLAIQRNQSANQGAGTGGAVHTSDGGKDVSCLDFSCGVTAIDLGQRNAPDADAAVVTAKAAQARADFAATGLTGGDAKTSWMEHVVDIREYDVKYFTRVAIDLEIFVGSWYDCDAEHGDVVVTKCDDSLYMPGQPRVCAFDIETTKAPLKFPQPETDQIYMISYMLDTQGYLIVNNEIVPEKIEAFEYSPKPEYEGHFEVFNEINEEALIRRFFDEMKLKKPMVYVTYNGDYFDWPFIQARAEQYDMSLRWELGFSMDPEGAMLNPQLPHLDCFYWVKRDSYLPQGSQGLKAVTKAKLGYEPIEVDPEEMLPLAQSHPQRMAAYSVSDAVSTYYLYMKYVNPFIFSLCTIIPLAPDDVLRKGSGTLCESLLCVQAFKKNVIWPNKQVQQNEKFHNGHLIDSETYIGGRVEALKSGVYRSDIPLKFSCVPEAFRMLAGKLDDMLKFAIEVENDTKLEDVTNYEEVKTEILEKLAALEARPTREETPLIYHLDVGAMYPNIILTNRLQPPSMVTPDICAACCFNGAGANENRCQRTMQWMWKGELFTAGRHEFTKIKAQLETEAFAEKAVEKADAAATTKKTYGNRRGNVLEGTAFDRARGGGPGGFGGRGGRGGAGGSGYRSMNQQQQQAAKEALLRPEEEDGSDGGDSLDENGNRKFHKLKENTRFAMLKKRMAEYSRKAYRKTHETKEILKDAIVCQRENSFYVDTVRLFRDRRYHYKRELKRWKGLLEKATEPAAVKEAKSRCIQMESLQLAHKCILNSFYGYVMRKGSRWYSMEMAGVVTYLGASLIMLARVLVQQIGVTLELDTDGIWCCLPSSFPEDFTFTTKAGKKFTVSYPCVMLNKDVADRNTNHQYQTMHETGVYTTHSECSIYFEVDGPYKAMILPASREEGKGIKKRYAVFNPNGSLAELKGFELKRRGELMLVKDFQSLVFRKFLDGTTLKEAYTAAASVAADALELLYTQGQGYEDEEVLAKLTESSNMTRRLAEYPEAQKSLALTTARRIADFLGPQMVKDKGLACHFIISRFPHGKPVTERPIPLNIFKAEDDVRIHFLRKWTGDNSLPIDTGVKDILDWDYYIGRFNACVQKIITIPAALQFVQNPLPRVEHPDWLRKAVLNRSTKFKQTSLTAFVTNDAVSGAGASAGVVAKLLNPTAAQSGGRTIQRRLPMAAIGTASAAPNYGSAGGCGADVIDVEDFGRVGGAGGAVSGGHRRAVKRLKKTSRSVAPDGTLVIDGGDASDEDERADDGASIGSDVIIDDFDADVAGEISSGDSSDDELAVVRAERLREEARHRERQQGEAQIQHDYFGGHAPGAAATGAKSAGKSAMASFFEGGGGGGAAATTAATVQPKPVDANFFKHAGFQPWLGAAQSRWRARAKLRRQVLLGTTDDAAAARAVRDVLSSAVEGTTTTDGAMYVNDVDEDDEDAPIDVDAGDGGETLMPRHERRKARAAAGGHPTQNAQRLLFESQHRNAAFIEAKAKALSAPWHILEIREATATAAGAGSTTPSRVTVFALIEGQVQPISMMVPREILVAARPGMTVDELLGSHCLDPHAVPPKVLPRHEADGAGNLMSGDVGHLPDGGSDFIRKLRTELSEQVVGVYNDTVSAVSRACATLGNVCTADSAQHFARVRKPASVQNPYPRDMFLASEINSTDSIRYLSAPIRTAREGAAGSSLLAAFHRSGVAGPQATKDVELRPAFLYHIAPTAVTGAPLANAPRGVVVLSIPAAKTARVIFIQPAQAARPPIQLKSLVAEAAGAICGYSADVVKETLDKANAAATNSNANKPTASQQSGLVPTSTANASAAAISDDTQLSAPNMTNANAGPATATVALSAEEEQILRQMSAAQLPGMAECTVEFAATAADAFDMINTSLEDACDARSPGKRPHVIVTQTLFTQDQLASHDAAGVLAGKPPKMTATARATSKLLPVLGKMPGIQIRGAADDAAGQFSNPLMWHRDALRRALQRLHALPHLVSERLNIARAAGLPVGNMGADPAVFALDHMFSSALQRHQHALWDPWAFTNEPVMQRETRVAAHGGYATWAVELSISQLDAVSVLFSQAIQEGDDPRAKALGDGGVGSHFGVLRDLVADLYGKMIQSRDVGTSLLLLNFPRWLHCPVARTYEPRLVSLVASLATRALAALLVRITKLGGGIISATKETIIIDTRKATLFDAQRFTKYVLTGLQDNAMLKHLAPSVTRYWGTLAMLSDTDYIGLALEGEMVEHAAAAESVWVSPEGQLQASLTGNATGAADSADAQPAGPKGTSPVNVDDDAAKIDGGSGSVAEVVVDHAEQKLMEVQQAKHILASLLAPRYSVRAMEDFNEPLKKLFLSRVNIILFIAHNARVECAERISKDPSVTLATRDDRLMSAMSSAISTGVNSSLHQVLIEDVTEILGDSSHAVTLALPEWKRAMIATAVATEAARANNAAAIAAAKSGDVTKAAANLSLDAAAMAAHLKPTNVDVSLKFVKELCAWGGLFPGVQSAVRHVKNNCLRLCHVNPFATEAQWTPPLAGSAAATLSCRCPYCNEAAELALDAAPTQTQTIVKQTLAQDSAATAQDPNVVPSTGGDTTPWRCGHCGTGFPVATVEDHLVRYVQRLSGEFVDRDFVCKRCRQVTDTLCQATCECGGELTVKTAAPVAEVTVVLAAGRVHAMEWLVATAEHALHMFGSA